VTEKSGRTVNYGYDNLYRLTNETIASYPNAINGALSYTYDAVGNRLQKTSTLPGMPGGASAYNPSTPLRAGADDELTTDAYDADGNTIGSGANTGAAGYVYDFENHLVQQGGISVVYDGDGNRVKKTVAGVVTQYLVADANPTGYAQVMAEQDSGGNVQAFYVYGSELVSKQPSSAALTAYYVYDGHGSVRALTNTSGAVTDTYDYDAFGNLLHSTGTSTNNYLFAGEQYDPDLHLYYNRARYLNTSTGRFWTMDTFEGSDWEPTSLHKYLYAGGDPTDRVDESGNDFDIGSEISAVEIGNTLAALPTLTAVEYLQGGSAEPRIATDQSGRGLEFLKYHEGINGQANLKPYSNDGSSTQNCTIGWGSLIHPGPCDPRDFRVYANFNQQEAEQLLFTDVMSKALAPIKRRVHVGLAQRELDALIDFTFNLGGAKLGQSILLQQLNAGNYKQAGNGFLGWLQPSGVLQRRNDEKNLWDTGIYVSNKHSIP